MGCHLSSKLKCGATTHSARPPQPHPCRQEEWGELPELVGRVHHNEDNKPKGEAIYGHKKDTAMKKKKP